MNITSILRRVAAAAFFVATNCAMPEQALAAGQTHSGRMALVLGNSDYPGRDKVRGAEGARAIASDLEHLHFDSIKLVADGDITTMRKALTEFKAYIKAARQVEGGVKLVFVYYSGHGFQLDRTSYLLPVHSTIDPTDLSKVISVDEVLLTLYEAPDEAVKLVFLDACRENADLPTAAGTSLQRVPGWLPGLAKQAKVRPNRTLLDYAADYDQVADSDSPDGYSPFTSALLNHIREPGLGVHDLVELVRNETLSGSFHRQRPHDEGLGSLDNFPLHPPASIDAVIGCIDDTMFVLLNGKIVLNSGLDKNTGSKPKRIALRAGVNELSVLVFNQKSYRNGQSWERPEGWSYWLRLLPPDDSDDPDGTHSHELRCSAGGEEVRCFEGHEDVPFKDGPHHGQLFVAATATLEVNVKTGEVKLSSRDSNFWNEEAENAAQNQAVLFEESVPDLGRELGIPFLAAISEFRQLIVTVRGNGRLQTQVRHCMEDGGEKKKRLEDLRTGVLATLDRKPIPFDQFAAGLTTCVGTPVAADLEDHSREPAPIECGSFFAFPDHLHGTARLGAPALRQTISKELILPPRMEFDPTFQQDPLRCCGGNENTNRSFTAVPKGLLIQTSGGKDGEWGVFNIRLTAEPGQPGGPASAQRWMVTGDIYCGPSGRFGARDCNVDVGASLAVRKQ